MKNYFKLCSLLMCFVMVSCGGNPIDKVKSLTEDIKNNGENWIEVSQWYDRIQELANTIIDFVDSNPSEEEYKAMGRALNRFERVMKEIDDDDVEDAIEDAYDKLMEEDWELYVKYSIAWDQINKKCNPGVKDACEDVEEAEAAEVAEEAVDEYESAE